VSEGDAHARGLEESFLDGTGKAGEREVGDWVRGLKEARRVAYVRREGRERWDEGRIGGLRG
jgi:hypothetical protein